MFNHDEICMRFWNGISVINLPNELGWEKYITDLYMLTGCYYTNCLIQDCSNSIANALELLQSSWSYSKPSMWFVSHNWLIIGQRLLYHHWLCNRFSWQLFGATGDDKVITVLTFMIGTPNRICHHINRIFISCPTCQNDNFCAGNNKHFINMTTYFISVEWLIILLNM